MAKSIPTTTNPLWKMFLSKTWLTFWSLHMFWRKKRSSRGLSNFFLSRICSFCLMNSSFANVEFLLEADDFPQRKKNE
jgi:hypothetical protein